jgi:DNA replication protein DnaC
MNEYNRDDIIDSMNKLKLIGMISSYDEIIADSIKSQDTISYFIGGLLKSEIKTRKLAAIRTRMNLARFPQNKDLYNFIFSDTPINSQQVRHC